MDQPRQVSTRAMASLIVLVALAAGSAGCQAQAPAAGSSAPSDWAPQRLPDGQPDMQGIYVPNWPSTVPVERWTEAEAEEYATVLARMRGEPLARSTRPTAPSQVGQVNAGGERDLQGDMPPPGTVMVVDPPDGRIPYQPWAAAKRRYMRDHIYDHEEFVSTRTRCFPAGIRDMNIGSNYTGWQIVQVPGLVIITHEWHHTYRIIRLDGRPHLGPKHELWMGDARGRWEGNTLIVDTRNFTDKTWVVGEIDGEGPSNNAFHSPALRVTERFTLVDADRIDYEATYEDPNVFTRPWTLRRRIWKRAPKDYVIFEYACHEGNVGWENMKAGLGLDMKKPLMPQP